MVLSGYTLQFPTKHSGKLRETAQSKRPVLHPGGIACSSNRKILLSMSESCHPPHPQPKRRVSPLQLILKRVYKGWWGPSLWAANNTLIFSQRETVRWLLKQLSIPKMLHYVHTSQQVSTRMVTWSTQSTHTHWLKHAYASKIWQLYTYYTPDAKLYTFKVLCPHKRST